MLTGGATVLCAIAFRHFSFPRAVMEHFMAFPPNYNQERRNRENSKNRKALEKQSKRDEKNAQRKHEGQPEQPSAEPKKEE